VIIKQEPGETVAQQSGVTAVSTQQAVQQFVTVKGGQVIAVSPQKHSSGLGTGVTQTKVVGIPVGSTLQPVVKQAVALSGGQIIVAKPGTTVARAVSQKQIVAQGVAKAVVSGASGTIVAAPVQAVTKSQSSSTVQKSGSQGSGRKNYLTFASEVVPNGSKLNFAHAKCPVRPTSPMLPLLMLPGLVLDPNLPPLSPPSITDESRCCREPKLSSSIAAMMMQKPPPQARAAGPTRCCRCNQALHQE
ncbi:YEATS domain-containing protein 2-like, partial [Rhincodon typus]|uniref:YEATS domain-containing protein 2-like n=1 Tax=Rhincodon typus TaxID=259920 RepID=UPI00202ED16D